MKFDALLAQYQSSLITLTAAASQAVYTPVQPSSCVEQFITWATWPSLGPGSVSRIPRPVQELAIGQVALLLNHV